MPDQLPTDSPLTRPAFERARDYKYRLAQSLIFGLPVLALEFFGPKLGGPESSRWIGLFQALLTGWVMYIGALPILIEEVIFFRALPNPARKQWRGYAVLACLWALGGFLVGVVHWISILIHRISFVRSTFAISVSIVIILCAWQWLRFSRRAAT